MDAARRGSAQLAVLSQRVAEAADAWLSDPRDVGVYGRLVAAIEARRSWLNPTLDEPAETEGDRAGGEGEAGQSFAESDELPGAERVPRLGEGLAGSDAREVLRRLREPDAQAAGEAGREG